MEFLYQRSHETAFTGPWHVRIHQHDRIDHGRQWIPANRPIVRDALAELKPERDALCEMTRTRTFEIAIDSHQKVRVQVIAFDDESLPSPGEREKWRPRPPSNVEIHAAVSALYMARDLKHFEQL